MSVNDYSYRHLIWLIWGSDEQRAETYLASRPKPAPDQDLQKLVSSGLVSSILSRLETLVSRSQDCLLVRPNTVRLQKSVDTCRCTAVDADGISEDANVRVGLSQLHICTVGHKKEATIFVCNFVKMNGF